MIYLDASGVSRTQKGCKGENGCRSVRAGLLSDQANDRKPDVSPDVRQRELVLMVPMMLVLILVLGGGVYAAVRLVLQQSHSQRPPVGGQ